MTISDFMNGVLDIALEHLKKQGVTFFMLVLATYFFYDQREKIESELNKKINNVETSLMECNLERFKLATDVADLKARFDERFKSKTK